jgi:NAD-dependent dihydropyrimidine dehydrogenase PreA subunit
MPIINEDRCSGCGRCMDVCRQHAIKLIEQPAPQWRDLLGLPLKYKARLVSPQACIGCGHCAAVCRHRAIEIERVHNTEL